MPLAGRCRDHLYPLTSASGGPAGSTSYTYDPVGNRLSRTRNGTSSLSYAYDRADRITSAGATSYTVDAVGNMTVRGADCLGYDQANRLKTLDTGCNSSTDASYVYDGDGKRTSKTVGSTTTTYVFDVNRGLPVILEDGTRRYVWGLGLAYEVEGSSALVYHVDGLGSVRALTDSSKAVVQTYESDEFGVPITTSGGSAQPFGFTGEQRDAESGLMHLRSRYYDPTSGRFAQRDPLLGDRSRSQSLNRCIYAQNNPLHLSDPSGLKAQTLATPPSPLCTPGRPCFAPGQAPLPVEEEALECSASLSIVGSAPLALLAGTVTANADIFLVEYEIVWDVHDRQGNARRGHLPNARVIDGPGARTVGIGEQAITGDGWVTATLMGRIVTRDGRTCTFMSPIANALIE